MSKLLQGVFASLSEPAVFYFSLQEHFFSDEFFVQREVCEDLGDFFAGYADVVWVICFCACFSEVLVVQAPLDGLFDFVAVVIHAEDVTASESSGLA